MPEVIPIGAGVIEHEYTFGGEKIKKIGEEGTRIYLGGFEYKDGNLEYINIPNGRILKENVDRYQYNLTDHLGNVVVMFEDISGDEVIQIEEETNGVNDEVLQRNHYYSFGMRVEMPLFNMGDDPKNKYLYNGKENADDYDLNWLYYGFRMYDPVIGRFPSVDPIADEFAFVSPFNYAENNVPMSIDLWGLQKYVVHQYYDGNNDLTRTSIAFHTTQNDDGQEEIVDNGATADDVLVMAYDVNGNLTTSTRSGLNELEEAILGTRPRILTEQSDGFRDFSDNGQNYDFDNFDSENGVGEAKLYYIGSDFIGNGIMGQRGRTMVSLIPTIIQSGRFNAITDVVKSVDLFFPNVAAQQADNGVSQNTLNNTFNVLSPEENTESPGFSRTGRNGMLFDKAIRLNRFRRNDGTTF